MPDLLTHALAAYVLATLLSARSEWITPRYVTIAMMGAFVPDLTKIDLLLPSGRIAAALGVPFDWFALHTVGGASASVLIGTVLVPRRYRKRVAVLLALGAASHLLLDGLLLKPSGYAAPLLWPLAAWRPPTPGLYHSTDRLPAVVAGILAVVTWYARYRVWTPDTVPN